MSSLTFIDSFGHVNIKLVPLDILNVWLSKLNGAPFVEYALPIGMHRQAIIDELESRRKNTKINNMVDKSLTFIETDKDCYCYEDDWREHENEQGFTHLEELLIYQPEDWKKQAREYYYMYNFDLQRQSANVEGRVHTIDVQYVLNAESHEVEVPIILESPMHVVVFHPDMKRTTRYAPLNFLLAYGVKEPEIKSTKDFFPETWEIIYEEIKKIISPLDYFFAFQENVELYDFGLLRDMAEKVNFPRLPLITELDFSSIVGQRMAKHMIRKEVVHWMWNRTSKDDSCFSNTPLSMIFAGPSGNGKTGLAEQLAKLLNKPGDHKFSFHKVDCGKLRDDHELFGMSGAYWGSQQGSSLNNFAVKMSKEPDKIGVVLLDEIEKVNKAVIHALYQVIDKGEWTNKRMEATTQTTVVSCKNLIFVMTTNAADDIIMSEAENNHVYLAPSKLKYGGLGEYAKNLESTVRQKLQMTHPFTEAFVGRVGCVVPFLPLSNGDPNNHPLLGEMMTVAKMLIDRDIENMEEGRSIVGLAPTMTPYHKDRMARVIVRRAISGAGVRSIQKCVKDELGKEVLHDCLIKDGGLQEGTAINFTCDDKENEISYRSPNNQSDSITPLCDKKVDALDLG